MADNQKPEKSETGQKSHRLLWGLVSAFIILAIAGMWAVDFYYSPEMINPNAIPDAVGK